MTYFILKHNVWGRLFIDNFILDFINLIGSTFMVDCSFQILAKCSKWSCIHYIKKSKNTHL